MSIAIAKGNEHLPGWLIDLIVHAGSDMLSGSQLIGQHQSQDPTLPRAQNGDDLNVCPTA